MVQNETQKYFLSTYLSYGAAASGKYHSDRTVRQHVGRIKMRKEIKNLIFDLGGVLVGLDGASCIRAFEQIGAYAVTDYVRERRTEDLFLDIELGRISTEEFCRRVRTMSDCAAKDEEIVQAWNSLLTEIPEEKRSRLLTYAAQYRVFLLSNTNKMHWECCSSMLCADGRMVEDYFERVFLSYELRQKKPSQEIFRTVLERAALRAEDTLFIDDAPENCAAARQLGIRTFVNHTENAWMNENDLFG